ncbi:hypothetical protein D9757_003087 [Collybiopsis confluens]|uniref:DUF6593 domain-containing protein n=1 Tax=Collybiopsis confluens TaxID=2823264 RepID=A0A8H5HXH3_9AGAR|nr:hypothetical protein D9757_003087 [Collybiopsis confluens]
MVFTPVSSFVVRSREYGTGDDLFSTRSEVLPDHYVKRIWRKTATLSTPAFALGAAAQNINGNSIRRNVQYVNKSPDSNDRSVAFSTTSTNGILVAREGESGRTVLKVEWNAKNLERSSIMAEGQSEVLLKDFLKKSGILSSSLQSRSFAGPDGLEYKWKVIFCGDNPLYPENYFRELRCTGSPHPVATTARLITSRDGSSGDECHPIYIADQGLPIVAWIVATNAILDRLQAKPGQLAFH